MTSVPRHRYFGTPIDEWISRVPNELTRDAVGFWQIVPTFKQWFGLSGPSLEQCVRECIELLLRNGALPVQGNAKTNTWQLRSDLVAERHAMLENIIAYWHALGRDPDVGDIWFALPAQIENNAGA
jgi:hypothetical protein